MPVFAQKTLTSGRADELPRPRAAPGTRSREVGLQQIFWFSVHVFALKLSSREVKFESVSARAYPKWKAKS